MAGKDFWRRLRRRRLLRRAGRGDIDAMRTLASKIDPDYMDAMRAAYREVLGEDL